MKKHLLLISAVILTACQENTYNKIKDYLDTIEIVDAHEHQQVPADSLSYFSIRYPTSRQTLMLQELLLDLGKGGIPADSVIDKYWKYYNYSQDNQLS